MRRYAAILPRQRVNHKPRTMQCRCSAVQPTMWQCANAIDVLEEGGGWRCMRVDCMKRARELFLLLRLCRNVVDEKWQRRSDGWVRRRRGVRKREGGGREASERRRKKKKRRKSVELIRVRDNTPVEWSGVRYRRNGLRRVTEGVGQGRERPLSTYARGW